MLRQWGATCARACEAMIADIRAGRLVDDTLVADYDYLRRLMGRREIIVNEIMKAGSRHRGPGTPLYVDLGNRDIERPENSPVDCFQRDGAGRPLGTGNRNGEGGGRDVVE